MQTMQLQGVRVAILVTHGFEQVEMTDPRKALEVAGADTTLAAPQPVEVQAMRHDEKSETFPVDNTIDRLDPNEFDAVLLPGGALNADKLRMDQHARDFVRAMDQQGKPIAAICHAPWLLVSAGLVKGRILTSYYTLQDDIRCAGGTWQDQEVVRDRNWVTSRQPKDIPAFNRATIELIGATAPSRARR